MRQKELALILRRKEEAKKKKKVKVRAFIDASTCQPGAERRIAYFNAKGGTGDGNISMNPMPGSRAPNRWYLYDLRRTDEDGKLIGSKV